jgi:hypothetical protein
LFRKKGFKVLVEDSRATVDKEIEQATRKAEACITMVKDGMVLLTCDNYFLWKSVIEDHLCCKDLDGPIIHEGVMPTGEKADDWKRVDRKCLATIRKYVDPSVRNHISEETTAYEAWKTLKETYESPSSNNKVLLLRKFVFMKYVEGTSMATHLNELKGIINQLNQMKFGLSDEAYAVLILITLPDSWAGVSTALSNQKGNLTVSLVTTSLLEEEIRRKHTMLTSSSSGETVAYVNERGRQGRKKTGEGKACFYCGKSGHVKKECWIFKKDTKNNCVKENSEANLVVSDILHVEPGKSGKAPLDLI